MKRKNSNVFMNFINEELFGRKTIRGTIRTIIVNWLEDVFWYYL